MGLLFYLQLFHLLPSFYLYLTTMKFDSSFPIFFVFLLALKYANGIKCHVCNSKEDIKCTDPFNVSSTLQECVQGWFGGAGGKTFDVIEIIMQNLDSGGNNGAEQKTASASVDDKANNVMVCQKIVVIVGEEAITSRGCSPKLVDGMHPCDAVKLSTPERTVQLRQCFTCPSDACNATTGVVLSPWLLAGFTLFASLLCHIKGH